MECENQGVTTARPRIIPSAEAEQASEQDGNGVEKWAGNWHVINTLQPRIFTNF